MGKRKGDDPMLRLLYVTDTHIRGTAPRSRTDDFVEALRNKLNEVIDIAGREKVNAVLHGGDLFDRPDLSPAVVRDFARLLRRLETPVYTIAGNHDIYGHNPETVDRSMLGLLDAFGTVGSDPVRRKNLFGGGGNPCATHRSTLPL